MSTENGGARAAEAPVPTPEVQVLTCPNCGRTVATRDDLIAIEHPGEWETIDQAIVDADMAELGIAPGMVGPMRTRLTRLEYVGCHECMKPEPVKVVVH